MKVVRKQHPPEALDQGEIARALRAFSKGDFSVRMPAHHTGIDAEIAAMFNDVVRKSEAMAVELARVRDQVGKAGRTGQRATVPGASGAWLACVESVNTLIGDLERPTVEVARVIDAVAKGDLSQKMTMEARGEILELKRNVNTMVDQLNGFASEVSRVAREVGTEGRLGGQAQVPGAAGIWKDLTDHVNLMAANLTSQVRGIASIVTAVAHGDLDRKLVFEARGEIAALADTINGMIDTLATFAEQVTQVASDVGVEGRLGGQARVPGAAGLWRDLTDNVNQLAAHLTTQVRAISEVATAVAQGDLTQSIRVDARGEVAVLKNNINDMIRTLAGTTRENTEQDWLKTSLANFNRALQGHRELGDVSRLILDELAQLMDVQQGVVYARNVENDKPSLVALATRSANPGRNGPEVPHLEEELIERCADEKKPFLLNAAPAERIAADSGVAAPPSVIVMPALFEGEVKAVIGLTSAARFSEAHLTFLEQLAESIGVVFNTIEATMRTERLLVQSRSLTADLQNRQEELRRTNQRLHENARLLSEQMKQVEYKNREIEQARAALEEKAEQLELSSRYKSEFLANMSHELRTPLNSLLILAQMLAENPASNLTAKQIEYAQTIFAAGNDLLALINDVLDLAKVESGTVSLHFAAERLAELRHYLGRAFRQAGHDKALQFRISVDKRLPPAIRTDVKRLRQILKNLLSNAFKFTPEGSVSLVVSLASSGWTPGQRALDEAETVVAFAVIDTGIGIPPDKQQIIFDAFRQADGTTSRHFGGTGLGLSISANLSQLLGGEIKVQSSPGRGSTFTLYLPIVQNADGGARPADSAGSTAVPQAPAETASGVRDPGEDATSAIHHPSAAGASRVPGLAGATVLLVDDDIRNIFALSSALEEQGITVMNAETGMDGVSMLQNHPEIDVVLIDMMMPDLDGYDTIRAMRGLEQFGDVPIIGVSAKAMKGDREKCIEAGASDYVPKPVNIAHLLSIIRAWQVK